MIDDLGRTVEFRRPARRVVSLVPSLTEALASVDAAAVVGATEYCTHPAELRATRVRGTKNPDTRAIAALEPDVVVMNQEENRAIDVERLERLGVPVWVTRIDTLDEAFESLRRLIAALEWPEPGWLAAAQAEWAPPPERSVDATAFVWRDPWMAIGRQTYADDVLARLGIHNSVAAPRYPTADPADVASDVVILPSEPYAFSTADGPEAFPGRDVRLIDGRLLVWYGPSLLGARAELTRQLFG